MDPSTSNNHISAALPVKEDATVRDSQRQSLGSPAPSVQASFQNSGTIRAGGNVTTTITAITGPGFERFRDKDIGEETSRLHSLYRRKYLPTSRHLECKWIGDWIRRSEPIAWLHGGAGIGKSTFAHHLVLTLNESNHLATYCFFVRDSSAMKNLNTVIEHMAYELGYRHPEIRPDLAAVHPPPPYKSLSDRLTTFIIAPLSKLPANEPRVILFDALDECPRSQDLLEAIGEILRTVPANVKFLVTSRSGGEIEEFIKRMQDSVYNLNISLVGSSTMKSFFNHRLEDVWDLQKYMDDLIDRAGGLFIWADTVCTFATSPINGNPSELLRIALSPQDSPYSAEEPLDKLYSVALEHLFPSTNRLARDNFKAVFAAMYVAFSPLNAQALEELVANAPGGIVSSLRSLQTRPSDDGRVAPAADLFHASFLDFIVSKDRCKDAHFRIEPVEAHKKVATLCIELLSKTFKDTNGPTPCAELSSAVRYAIGNWASHAAECISKLDSQDIPSAWKTFLGTHGNRWGVLLLSVIADTVPASSDLQEQGDDLLSWLNAEFLKLYRKKPLAGGGKVWAQRQLTVLLANLFRYNDIPENWTQATSLWPRENPGLASSFNNLASFFYSQFYSNRSITDLDEAISLSKAARSLQPTGHITLNNLAIYVLSKFNQTGCEKDLKGSIDGLHQLVVKIRPPGFDRAWSLNNLASILTSRFNHTGSKEDLVKAIELHKKALCLLSSDSNRPISLGNLAQCLETHFENDGLLETLEDAISLHRQALSGRNSRHPDYPGCLIALAHSLRLRGGRTGSREDLDEAISRSQEALRFYLVRNNDGLSTAQVGDSPKFHSEGGIREEFEAFPPAAKAEDSPGSHLEQGGIQNQHKAASTQIPPMSMQRRSHNKAKVVAPASFLRWTSHRTDRSECLTALALAFRARFQRNGSLKDLDKAVSLHQEALGLRPAPHPDRAVSLDNLGYTLTSRFNQSRSLEDVDEAISLRRKALELRPAPHPDCADSLDNLRRTLASRFNQSGSLEDVDEAISLHRKALELRPAPHPYRAVSLSNLACSLTFRIGRTKSKKDIDEAISLRREALELRPAPLPGRAQSLSNLAYSLEIRFNQSGSLEDVDEAILLHRKALELRPAPHPDCALFLGNLGCTLTSCFSRGGPLEDVDEAISLHRKALELRPAPHPYRAAILSNLARSLIVRLERTDHAQYLSYLAYYLTSRFNQSGSLEDVDGAISLHRKALKLRPALHPDRAVSLDNLGHTLTRRFNQSGSLEDVDEAISLHQEALGLRPAPHPDRAVSLDNLGHILTSRFNQSGSLEDVDEAISLRRKALELRPAPHPGHAKYLFGLANSLGTRFEQSGSLEDADRAILRYREVLRLRPAPHPDRPSSLNNLAFYIQCRYEQVGSQDALDEAISLHQEALEQYSAANPNLRYVYSLANLANCLRFQFMRTKATTDLNRAISLHKEALQLLPSHHPLRPLSLHGLAESLRRCGENGGAQDNLEEVISLHREALQSPATSRPFRFEVLCDLAECFQSHPRQKMSSEDLAQAVLLYRKALKLLPVSHFRHQSSIRDLREILLHRFDLTRTQEDLDEIRKIGQILDDGVIKVKTAGLVYLSGVGHLTLSGSCIMSRHPHCSYAPCVFPSAIF